MSCGCKTDCEASSLAQCRARNGKTQSKSKGRERIKSE